MELREAVLDGMRDRMELLNAYLGNEEDPERWALDALAERLCELEEYAGVVRGVSTWIDDAPDFDDVRLELVGIHQDLDTTEFAVAVSRDIDALPVDGTLNMEER